MRTIDAVILAHLHTMEDVLNRYTEDASTETKQRVSATIECTRESATDYTREPQWNVTTTLSERAQ